MQLYRNTPKSKRVFFRQCLRALISEANGTVTPAQRAFLSKHRRAMKGETKWLQAH
jgi:hypothetical protein